MFEQDTNRTTSEEPSMRSMFQQVGLWGRPMALFVGGFSVLNLVGQWRYPGFDANLWWIDLRFVPPETGRFFLFLASSFLLVFSIRPKLRLWRKWITFGFVLLLYLVCIWNVVVFYVLLAQGKIRAGVPVPFSLLVSMGFEVIGIAIVAGRGEVSRAKERRIFLFVPTLCIVLFPLAQMFFFGMTDYRRPADVVVVFGARVYSDGRLSLALSDRVRTGCELYKEGLAKYLVLSGGPGDGAVHETEAMRRFAIEQGVPQEAILLDAGGVNTKATVDNTVEMVAGIGKQRVLVVSHFYHLPRIKMTYQRAGLDVYTVPAEQTRILAGMPRYLLREIVAIWVYYLRSLVP
ncbi:MAG: YdcF family protein [Sedimentisphaerales bacterium]|nr:YdcF family protein [Sedimentisphaerales bacterium]